MTEVLITLSTRQWSGWDWEGPLPPLPLPLPAFHTLVSFPSNRGRGETLHLHTGRLYKHSSHQCWARLVSNIINLITSDINSIFWWIIKSITVQAIPDNLTWPPSSGLHPSGGGWREEIDIDSPRLGLSICFPTDWSVILYFNPGLCLVSPSSGLPGYSFKPHQSQTEVIPTSPSDFRKLGNIWSSCIRHVFMSDLFKKPTAWNVSEAVKA